MLINKTQLVVLGSINVDHIMTTEEFPQPGETLQAKHYQVAFGGKGANQAVAAARSGASTQLIGCVGQDAFGLEIKQKLQHDHINTDAVTAIEGTSTGVALIFLNHQAENFIGIHSGANAALDINYVERFKERICSANALLLQLETPIESVYTAAQIAKQANTRVILNPAPAYPLESKLLSLVDIIIPNESETLSLTKIKINTEDDAHLAAQAFHNMGIDVAIITMGDKGVFLSEKDKLSQFIPAFKVNAIDSIAAGDTFTGAFTTALLEGKSLHQSVIFANAAAAISVTRHGAQPSIPYRKEIDDFLATQ